MSIWNYIAERSPPPEKDEIASFIGRPLIQANENLWAEQDALREIAYEFTDNSNVVQKESLGRKGFKDAINFSKAYYDPRFYVIESEDALSLRKIQSFNLEYVVQNVDRIRAIIESENGQLEKIIYNLQDSIENPREKEAFPGVDISDAAVRANVAIGKPNSKQKETSQAKKTTTSKLGDAKRLEDKPIMSKSLQTPIQSSLFVTSASLADLSINEKNKNNNSELSPSTAAETESLKSTPRSGKFRSRIKEAQSDSYNAALYLSDDYLV